jgi:signal transduction histidine kinase
MTPRSSRTLIILIDVLLITMGVIGSYRVAMRAGLPVAYTIHAGEFMISGAPTAVPDLDLQAGDRIHAFDDQVVTSPANMEFLIDHLQLGDEAALTIERDGTFLTVTVPLVKFYSIRYLIIQCLVGALYFFLAIFVLIRKPADRAALLFHWLTVSIAVMVMSTWASYTIKPHGLGHVSQILDLAANAAIPLLFIHFSFIFPRDKLKVYRKFLPLAYVVAAFLLVWMTVTFLIAISPPTVAGYNGFLVAFNSTRWLFSLCLVVGLGSFVHTFVTTREGTERRQIRWILLGLIISALGFTILWRIPYLIFERAFISDEVVVLISTAAPIAFAIAIVRYQFMDIDLIFNRGTVYGIVIGSLLALYALIVGTVAVLVGTLTIRISLITSGIAAVIVAVLFEPTRRSIQHFVDRTFFRIKYNYREAQRLFADDIAHCVDVQGLSRLVVNRLDDLLLLEQIGLIVKGASGRPLALRAHRNGDLFESPGFIDQLKDLPYSGPLLLALTDRIEPGAPHEPADPELFRKMGIVLIATLLSEYDEILGYLVLGPKKSGARFHQEDMDLISSIATQAGLAVERIVLNQKLVLEREETLRLEELNQLKSYFVSSVSHELKTPLTSIKMFAELLQTKSKLEPTKSKEYLEIIAGESERLSARIENVLDFAKVERGVKEYHFQTVKLNELVENVLKSLSYQIKLQNFQIHLSLRSQESTIHADPEAVSESLTNLLSNAMKYSRETKEVDVSMFQCDDHICVEVKDRGIGISEEDKEHIFEPFYRAREEYAGQLSGAGLGLPLVKHTMEAHHGKIEVQSELGKGSTFTLYFPVEENRETHSDR